MRVLVPCGLVLGTLRLMGADTAFLACFSGLEGTAFFSCLVPVFCAVFAAPCSRQALQHSSSFSQAAWAARSCS